MKRITFLSLSTLFSFTQCGSKQNNSQTLTTQANMKNEESHVVTQTSVVNGNNLFSNDLLKNYLNSEEQKGKNIFLSPFSIYSALSMTSEGANGSTAEEMQQVLHLPAVAKIRQSEMDSLTTALNPAKADYKLIVVNALWAQKGYSFLPEFVSVNTSSYKSKIENLDFVQHPDVALKTINTWVEEKTNEKIKNLISDKNVTKDTRLILTNAIYFKADWAHPFEIRATKISEFILPDNIKIEASMMNTNHMFPYMENELLQSVEIPYKGDELSMILILPKAGVSPEQLLTKVNLTACFASRDTWERVRLSMPKFKVEAKYLMKDEFKKMGLIIPFTEKANFSGISKSDALVIGEIIHQTFVEVNETGTEAAAATAVGLDAGSAPKQPKIFNANHPFIYVIRHNVTGAILFTGVLNNPNEM